MLCVVSTMTMRSECLFDRCEPRCCRSFVVSNVRTSECVEFLRVARGHPANQSSSESTISHECRRQASHDPKPKTRTKRFQEFDASKFSSLFDSKEREPTFIVFPFILYYIRLLTLTMSNPVAVAVPVGKASSSDDLHCIAVPVGCKDLGFQVSGSPPRISHVNFDSPLRDQLMGGHYVHGLLLPGLEIVNLMDSNHLMQLLHANVPNPRHLLVSHNQFFVDPSMGKTARGALYKHQLLPQKDLGFTMDGFPPVIHAVLPHSALYGRLLPQQTVEALVVPQRPVMNLAAGGFTAAKVQQRLLETAHMEGRQLVVSDIRPAYHKGRQKGSSAPMDDCVIQ